MKRFKHLRQIIDGIMDHEREFNERIYLALSVVSELCVIPAFIVDIITNENPYEIVAIALTLIAVPTITYTGLHFDRVDLVIKITVVGLMVGVIPALFFYGGGVEGGGVLWIIFSFTYAGLVLTGAWRTTILILISIEAMAFYLLNYYFPQLVNTHDRGMFYLDSFISLMLVGLICFAMTWLQSMLFKGENQRARDAAEKAEELSRAQNRFFSSMSHEIRTPINSILGLNELILRDQSASDEIIKDATGIQGSGKMLLALINDILDFSKMEAGSMDIVPVDYKVGDLLSEIVNMVWIRANDKGLELKVSIDPEVPSVLYGDEVRIKQIIVNLLNNAVKYTAEGSVELHVESEKKDVKTVELTISVTDTGMGIKKEVVPYLFDAFKRVDEEKNRHIEGTGLGLSIVKQLVELMGGTVTVNSVYGEGSTFTVVLSQGISNPVQIGELNIHNQSIVHRKSYESTFRAPEASILIVDDNEMNLEVERKLLADTEMTIDGAISGKDALELALKRQYDVILMDHLMPEMDGIECLEELRKQVGSLNRTTPVIVLTANAGSENRELYNRAGFDGYLVKPVSGEMLENMLIKYIPDEKLIINNSKVMTLRENINAAAGYSGKVPIIITSSSMCDLPDSIIRKYNIPILPFMVKTEEGWFKDGVQMGADELIRYMNSGKKATSSPPDEFAYTEFFAATLRRTHHIIHISITDSMSNDYEVSKEAAKSFENVTVVNSECLSSATGILVLIAYKLTQMTDSVDEIVSELEKVKPRLKCSFVIDTTEYMAKKDLVSDTVDRIARSLNMHPCLSIRNNKSGIGGIWVGNRKRAYKKYIAKAFPVDVIPDPEVVFITYSDVPTDTLLWIKEEISKIAYFEHVVFKQASAAISSNCGPGSFGILYFIKSNKNYNISSMIDEDDEYLIGNEVGDEEVLGETIEEDIEEAVEETDAAPEPEESTEPQEWYRTIDGIDGEIAIKNSGSEDAFKTVLKIFYDSIEDKSAEIEQFFSEEDYKNYTIKVHALKSSCKLIGAKETAEKAQLLENAGKGEDIDYIKDNHAAFMEEYLKYKDALKPVFEENAEAEKDKPVADDFLMESVYEGMLDAADKMDIEAMEAILKEVEGYAIPKDEQEKFKALCDMVGNFDYDGIVELLKT